MPQRWPRATFYSEADSARSTELAAQRATVRGRVDAPLFVFLGQGGTATHSLGRFVARQFNMSVLHFNGHLAAGQGDGPWQHFPRKQAMDPHLANGWVQRNVSAFARLRVTYAHRLVVSHDAALDVPFPSFFEDFYQVLPSSTLYVLNVRDPMQWARRRARNGKSPGLHVLPQLCALAGAAQSRDCLTTSSVPNDVVDFAEALVLHHWRVWLRIPKHRLLVVNAGAENEDDLKRRLS